MKVLRGMAIVGVALAMAVLGRNVSATTLIFDDIPVDPTYKTFIDGYGGLNWSYFYALDGAACNLKGDATISSFAPFTFNSASFSALGYDGLTVTVDGYRNGENVGLRSFVVVTTQPTIMTFDWTVDQLIFQSFITPTDPSGPEVSKAGTQFAMDNMTINEPVSAVPLPAAVWAGLPLLGLLGAWKAGRKRQAQVG